MMQRRSINSQLRWRLVRKLPDCVAIAFVAYAERGRQKISS